MYPEKTMREKRTVPDSHFVVYIENQALYVDGLYVIIEKLFSKELRHQKRKSHERGEK